VTRLFNRYVKHILGSNGEFSVGLNNSGNLDFDIRTKDTVASTQAKITVTHITSITACCAHSSDLAVLKRLKSTRFYHFAYHGRHCPRAPTT